MLPLTEFLFFEHNLRRKDMDVKENLVYKNIDVQNFIFVKNYHNVFNT